MSLRRAKIGVWLPDMRMGIRRWITAEAERRAGLSDDFALLPQ